MKIGQKVKLKHLRKCKKETENWSKRDELKKNEVYTISDISPIDKWLLFDGKRLYHSPDKFQLVKEPKPATLEIYPYRGGFRYRKIAANGKILNHHYNTVAAAKKGADAERRFFENFKIIVKK